MYHLILQAYDAIRPFHFEWRTPPPAGPPENHKAVPFVYKLNIDSLTKPPLPGQVECRILPSYIGSSPWLEGEASKKSRLGHYWRDLTPTKKIKDRPNKS